MATVVNIHDAKSTLSRLVKRAAAGEEILIANHGHPIAMLSKIPSDRLKMPWDMYKGQLKMADDFDAPMEEFQDYV